MKDNFSVQAKGYSIYRPHYPPDMINHILSFINNKGKALDVATGNGQVAAALAPFFTTVYGIDISATQLDNAVQRENIIYKEAKAEETGFNTNEFDLITVAQAIHWFDFDAFYKEVYRILKPSGIIAVMGYGLFRTDVNTDKIINRFYNTIIGEYWDAERKYVEEEYKTIPFPFDEIYTDKSFTNAVLWTFEQLVGYLETWSAVQHYIRQKGSNPLNLIKDDLKESWKKSDKQVTFPLFLRMGRLEKR
ncbi:class I SAM-dependent methyltransferase [Flavobacterium salilacus subsp. salilacus]|uniref:class I SAM-dependent methyltransferase n=1 Tax=Flavobacterium TaxID=237 RepID=UPI0010750904|nr:MULTISPECIES: class I SAM-dependent methyltransferase [Flavobacterium]KAF2516861.1 class I SAM-dependent methyltransferase [Flavobacterium salilacus subsp. salilacus]MBE1615780.1 class I SAM-dependent methyltransferase [Flavobacterium sp. SaA2.13]